MSLRRSDGSKPRSQSTLPRETSWVLGPRDVYSTKPSSWKEEMTRDEDTRGVGWIGSTGILVKARTNRVEIFTRGGKLSTERREQGDEECWSR